MTACESCEKGYYKPVSKPYVEQDGDRVAVVTGVPVGRCPVCGHERRDPAVGARVDGMLAQMLRTCEVAVRRWEAEEES